MSLLSKLFGSRQKPEPEAEKAEDYKGFVIIPTPIKDGAGWRLSARIELGDRSHTLIRADTINDRDEAVAASVAKAKRMIDEQGERLFG